MVVGLCASVFELVPSGHLHAQQVARTQPEKFAAIEGLYETKSGAPMAIFGFPVDPPPELRGAVEIPYLLSWMAFGDVHAEVRGIAAFPKENRPPFWITFVSFHNMVILGMLFIGLMALAALQWWRGRLFQTRWLLRAFTLATPLPVLACQFGWTAAEVGRQPWIVYGLLRTADAHSVTVTAGEILFSLILFGIVYLGLFMLWIWLLVRKIRQGPAAQPTREPAPVPAPAAPAPG